MNAKSLIFSLLTGFILTLAALFCAFFLMWGMENYKTSVKPYAYLMYAAICLAIIIVGAAFAGPVSSLAARRFFSDSQHSGVLFNIAGSVLAIVVGAVAIVFSVGLPLAAFRDALPHLSSSMRVRFPANTRVVFDKSLNHEKQNGEWVELWNDKLIVRFDEAGWEEFRRNELFQNDELKISHARADEDLRNWETFENARREARIYRWTHHNERRILHVLARRGRSGEIYVYLYLLRNAKQLENL